MAIVEEDADGVEGEDWRWLQILAARALDLRDEALVAGTRHAYEDASAEVLRLSESVGWLALSDLECPAYAGGTLPLSLCGFDATRALCGVDVGAVAGDDPRLPSEIAPLLFALAARCLDAIREAPMRVLDAPMRLVTEDGLRLARARSAPLFGEVMRLHDAASVLAAEGDQTARHVLRLASRALVELACAGSFAEWRPLIEREERASVGRLLVAIVSAGLPPNSHPERVGGAALIATALRIGWRDPRHLGTLHVREEAIAAEGWEMDDPGWCDDFARAEGAHTRALSECWHLASVPRRGAPGNAVNGNRVGALIRNALRVLGHNDAEYMDNVNGGQRQGVTRRADQEEAAGLRPARKARQPNGRGKK